jgi:hypothetical protein
MKILGKYFKQFALRGLIAMGFGPIVLSAIYLILGLTGTTESVSVYELALGVITITALAFMAGGITTVYQIEEISLPTAIGAHAVILYICYAVVYLTNGWLADGIIPFVIFTAIFFVGFALIWTIIYLITKRCTDRINKNL